MKDHYLRNGLIADALLGMAGSIQYAKLVKASKNPAKASENTLRGILEFAKDTEYGKAHHFAQILEAKDADELYARWHKNVKLNDYEDFRPLVERHKHGESDILFPGKPVMYATTSGTTSEPKWIPITRTYLNNVYGKMTKVWLYNFIKNRPKVFHGSIVSIVGKKTEGYAPDGTVFGSVSGVTQSDCPQFVKNLYASPACVYAITDYTARYYTIMRMGIEKNVHLIVTANPSTVVEMQNNVNDWYDEYVKDIENGTLSDRISVPQEIRDEIQKFLSPNPERAAELRALKAKYGRVLPKHYWPELQILNTWKCGNTKIYLDKFKDSFPEGMLHQEFGYFSSECRFGLVLDDTNYTVLFPHMHYYEFVAEEDIDAAHEGKDVRFWQLHELVEGKRYCPYVTTYAGLYRYDMNDLLEVAPKFYNSPRVFMIQKINGIVTMTGEKLHERQFIEAVTEVAGKLDMPVKFFIGFAQLDESRYHFYYEFMDQNTTQEQADKFNAEVDATLKHKNIEYDSKRASFRVKDPVAHLLIKDSFETYKAQCIAAGARDGQFKLNLLLQDEKRHAAFRKLVKE